MATLNTNIDLTQSDKRSYFLNRIEESKRLADIGAISAARELLKRLSNHDSICADIKPTHLALFWGVKAWIEECAGNFDIANELLIQSAKEVSPNEVAPMNIYISAFEIRWEKETSNSIEALLSSNVSSLKETSVKWEKECDSIDAVLTTNSVAKSPLSTNKTVGNIASVLSETETPLNTMSNTRIKKRKTMNEDGVKHNVHDTHQVVKQVGSSSKKDHTYTEPIRDAAPDPTSTTATLLASAPNIAPDSPDMVPQPPVLSSPCPTHSDKRVPSTIEKYLCIYGGDEDDLDSESDKELSVKAVKIVPSLVDQSKAEVLKVVPFVEKALDAPKSPFITRPVGSALKSGAKRVKITDDDEEILIEPSTSISKPPSANKASGQIGSLFSPSSSKRRALGKPSRVTTLR